MYLLCGRARLCAADVPDLDWIPAERQSAEARKLPIDAEEDKHRYMGVETRELIMQTK
jgi:hypothetical protein